MRNTINNERVWELDFLRGIALLLMIYFHSIYDMKEMFGYKIDYESGINFLIGKTSAILFITISGVSCFLSRNNAKRGMKVIILSMIITAATWLYGPEFVIVFGILHFLGVCMLLAGPFMLLNQYLLFVCGTLIIIAGIFLSRVFVSHDFLFIFGIKSGNFVSADYYPLMPWLGFFLYGIGLGKALYRERKSIFKLAPGENIISRAGRKTLILYMLHQPVIIGVLALLTKFK